MRQPKLKKIFELATMFHSVAEASEGRACARMNETYVPKEDVNICETPACHAGWFGVIKHAESKRGTYYIEYAREMAKFLGMRDDDDLTEWACQNPIVWGNSYGDEMFMNARAFGESDDDGMNRVSIQQIAQHWYNVGERMQRQAIVERAVGKFKPVSVKIKRKEGGCSI